MNEMLTSSQMPNFSTSRPNINSQFSYADMSHWQLHTPTTELYTSEDYTNVWLPKSYSKDETDKDSFIKSIWDVRPSASSAGSSSGDMNHLTTSTNSPNSRIDDVINSLDRWGSVKINQTTPWTTVTMPEAGACQSGDPMVWRARVDGTEAWEEYYERQHGRRAESTQAHTTPSPWSETRSSPPLDLGPRESINGVRPSMTRQQAQRYLLDMGYSLRDAIGALVDNQMDLSKALCELQAKYRLARQYESQQPLQVVESPQYGGQETRRHQMMMMAGRDGGGRAGGYQPALPSSSSLQRMSSGSLGHDLSRMHLGSNHSNSVNGVSGPLMMGSSIHDGGLNGHWPPRQHQQQPPPPQYMPGWMSPAPSLHPTGNNLPAVGILISRVLPHHVDLIKAICFESVSLTHFQLRPHSRSIVAHFGDPREARRCMGAVQGAAGVRVEPLVL